MNIIRHSRDRRRGQGLVEYGVVVALIAVLAIGSLGILGAATTNVFSNITAGINNAVGMDSGGNDGSGDVSAPTDTPLTLTADPAVTSSFNSSLHAAKLNYSANVSGGSGNFSYQWVLFGFWRLSPGSGTFNFDCATFTANPTWTLDVTDQDSGAWASFSGSIPPVPGCTPISASPIVTSVAATVEYYGTSMPGVTLSFDANASGGNGDLSYEWVFSGVPRIYVASGTVDIPCLIFEMGGTNWGLNIQAALGLGASYSGTIPDVSTICGN